MCEIISSFFATKSEWWAYLWPDCSGKIVWDAQSFSPLPSQQQQQQQQQQVGTGKTMTKEKDGTALKVLVLRSAPESSLQLESRPHSTWRLRRFRIQDLHLLNSLASGRYIDRAGLRQRRKIYQRNVRGCWKKVGSRAENNMYSRVSRVGCNAHWIGFRTKKLIKYTFYLLTNILLLFI